MRELTNLDIRPEVDDKHTVCVLQISGASLKINGLSADEFPPLPKFKEDKKVVYRRKR